MKKNLFLVAGFAVAFLISCGPSAEEQKAAEEQKQKTEDSLAAVLLQQADSTIHPMDTIAVADTTRK
ncbi:MAG: hypothetical protein V1781_08725 [Bacteroidota bacterium]